MGQRGWKRHPFGGLSGLGTSPLRICLSRFNFGLAIGMALCSNFLGLMVRMFQARSFCASEIWLITDDMYGMNL